jgi:hypothetical protein
MEGRQASIRRQVLDLPRPPWIDEDEDSWIHEDVEIMIPTRTQVYRMNPLITSHSLLPLLGSVPAPKHLTQCSFNLVPG